MTVVSTNEFNTNQEKYFDNEKPDKIFKPDEDFHRSITADELLEGINEDIDIFFASK